ncbi:MAG: SGNH/GDSL hydrolase family protein [Bacteroides sp.]|nr:SGNH/GDSL hydrolase family protein [Bacteroides sp.]
MKRNVCKCLVSFSLFCLSFSCTDAVAQNNWANFGRYAQANKELPVPTKKEKRVVFMGNSITEGWVKEHPEFFTENNYIGRGISGQTSYQFLLRFREDVLKLKPALVVINAGTNDAAENGGGTYSEEVTLGNIISMVELAKANKVKVVLTSVLPASSFGWNRKITDAADRIASLNARIKEYAKKKRIPYVDYYKEMVSGTERSLNPAYTKDGVHPTKEGYLVMEAIIKPVIDKAL